MIFIGRTDAEASILWPPDAKNWLIGKDPDSGKDWRQEEKGMTEDEMVGWHHWLNGHVCEQAPGVADIQGSLVCCSPWGCKELDTTEQLNWGKLKNDIIIYSSNHNTMKMEINYKIKPKAHNIWKLKSLFTSWGRNLNINWIPPTDKTAAPLSGSLKKHVQPLKHSLEKNKVMKLGKIPQSTPPRAEEILKLRVEICEKEH